MNWGYKIVITLGVFIIFIVTLGYMFVGAARKEPAEKDYYEKGLAFDKEYLKKQNVIKNNQMPEFQQTEKGLEIQFKQSSKGLIKFLRTSNQNMDFEDTFSTDAQSKLVIPKGKLIGGLWEIELLWEEYLVREKVTIE